jgi:hypothetical protein
MIDKENMQTTVMEKQRVSPTTGHPVDKNFWPTLHSAAMAQMHELMNSLHSIAPKPGSLIYMEAKPLPYHWKGWQPVLLSSIDICTHLQIARIYLTATYASAIDFLNFIWERFLFHITEVRTHADPIFLNAVAMQSEHRFTSEAKRLGIFHSIVIDPMSQPVLSVVTKYFFGSTFEGNIKEPTEENVVAALVNYLYFHNNHRSLASLGGMTPLQKLKSFEGFDGILAFDPYQQTDYASKQS